MIGLIAILLTAVIIGLVSINMGVIGTFKDSEQSIEKVRQVADIVEVVSGYVELKQRGRNFFGLWL